MRAIDTMLFDVLGWDQLNVAAEKYCRAEGYADYVFSNSGGICLLLEAKKSDTTFFLPQNSFPSEPIGFGLLATECPDADKALRQVLGYAAGLGARYIAISNGHQWLFTLTFVQNQPIEERSVVVFESLEAIESRFRLFWDCFSSEGIEANRAYDILDETRRAPPPAKLSQRLPNYPAPAGRNVIANELSAVVGAVWEDVRHAEAEEDFLRACYVEPAASASAVALASELLSQRLDTDVRAFATSLDSSSAVSVLESPSPEKPIVVLGNVGNGKSTFLHVMRLIKAKEVLKKYIQIEMDFVDRPDDAESVPSFVYSQIGEALQSQFAIDVEDDAFVRSALNADLNRFRKSPEGKAYPANSAEYMKEELAFIRSIRNDRHTFFKRAFALIRGSRQTSIAIFFDNLDRRLPKIQEQAYLKASAMARDWSALIFVCLRPSTFYSSKAFGVLDSVAPKIISVPPAQSGHVLVRRIKYAKRYAEGENLPRSNQRAPLSSTFSAELPRVATFLDCLANSFRRNAKLVNLFDAISNGNTRQLLIYAYKFMTSLHLNTKEVLEKYDKDPTYVVPDHHALRAILFGDSLHYDPNQSVFINLFDVQHWLPIEHFTRIATLHFLSTVPDAHPTYGFRDVGDIYQYLTSLGYSPIHGAWTVRYLFERKCVESRDPIEKWEEGVRAIRITTLGKYHVSRLCDMFQYVDAVSVDTPILDTSYRELITEVFNIQNRLDRCENFIRYLNWACTNLNDRSLRQLWESKSKGICSELRAIRESVE
jgi:hypothetical protein